MEESKNPLKELSDAVKSAETGEARRLIDEVTEIMDQLDSARAKMSEKIFVDNYLPFFKNLSKSDPNSPLLLQWLSFAGGSYHEVDLIGSNGEVVAVVPPLMSRHALDIDKLEHVSFSQTVTEYERLKDIDPFRANAFLNTEMSQLPKCIHPGDAKEQAKRWVKLFKRYESGSNIANDTPVTKKISEYIGINYDDD